MRKMAIFVEGQTELYFMDRLLKEIVSERNLQLVLMKARGGNQSIRAFNIVQNNNVGLDKDFYIQIVDSGADNAVASDIRDNYQNLIQRGFTSIIGLRDVYPISRGDIPKLRRGLQSNFPVTPITVLLILGVMEVEAWFLAEHSHFERVHPNLTVQRINLELGFDPSCQDMQMRPQPASDLHNIYALEGRAYKKNRQQVQRVVNSLDYAMIYLSHPSKFLDVSQLMTAIDNFLT